MGSRYSGDMIGRCKNRNVPIWLVKFTEPGSIPIPTSAA